MKYTLTVITCFAIIGGFSGCSSKYPITYDSNPRGASLICGGNNQGYTPQTLYYDTAQHKEKTSKIPDSPGLAMLLGNNNFKLFRTIPCTAQWVSGVKQNYSNSWDLEKFPDGVRQTLQRPEGEGYQQDAQFALQVQQSEYQRRQAEAAESSANAQILKNTADNINDINKNIQMQQLNNNLNSINRTLKYGY